ncbi:hypothetical protein [Pseudonocardia nigra]|uniref:hypothetical protein n=1 Tax=Pseudonocardia nigra TaxID=1921578 RepID=UPI001FE545B6|nr:hypothetical protein [Pseudonocardia nigra]
MPHRSCSLRPDEFALHCGGAVVRVEALRELGLGRSTVAHRCRAGGPWRWLLPGIVMLTNGAPTRDDRRRAALLYAGDGAVLTGLDALELHGMRRVPSPSGPVHVLLPADRRRAGSGRVLAERTDRLPVPEPGRWPLAPIARAVLDFARRIRERDQVRSAIAEVVQRNRCTPAQLHAEVEAGSGRGTKLPREVLTEISDGVRSVAEANARALVRRSALPAPMWNVKLYDRAGRFLAMPDAWFDDVGLAWEIDSKEWHLSPEDYERTLDRRSTIMAEDIVVMHTQPSKLELHPTRVLDELRRNYRNAARSPRPPVYAIPSS